MKKSRPAAAALTSHTSIGNKALTWQISRPAAGVTSHPLTENSAAIGAMDGTPTVGLTTSVVKHIKSGQLNF